MLVGIIFILLCVVAMYRNAKMMYWHAKAGHTWSAVGYGSTLVIGLIILRYIVTHI